MFLKRQCVESDFFQRNTSSSACWTRFYYVYKRKGPRTKRVISRTWEMWCSAESVITVPALSKGPSKYNSIDRGMGWKFPWVSVLLFFFYFSLMLYYVLSSGKYILKFIFRSSTCCCPKDQMRFPFSLTKYVRFYVHVCECAWALCLRLSSDSSILTFILFVW